MPITQNRMLALIEVADAFKDKVLECEKVLSEIFRDLPPNPTLAECLKTLESIQLYRKHLTLSAPHLDTLAVERAHFTANATRNIRHANRAKRKRGAEPTQNRSTAPDTIRKAPKPFKTIFQKWEGLEEPMFKPFGAVTTDLPKTNDTLIRQKIKLNEMHKNLNMKEPYPDVHNDDEPLQPEHRRFLGLPVEDDEGPF
jgi:hypothetical protein